MVHAQETLKDIVLHQPAAAQLLTKHGLDYCCRGNRSLQVACDDIGISAADVIQEIHSLPVAADGAYRAEQHSVADMVEHIEHDHHAFTREALASLVPLAHKVARVHGDAHPFLHVLCERVDLLDADLQSHLAKEERVLFPLIRTIAEGGDAGARAGAALEQPLYIMDDEHTAVGDLLAEMEELTQRFSPPAQACTSWRALYGGLAELAHDLRVHIHLENHALFPRARALAHGAPR